MRPHGAYTRYVHGPDENDIAGKPCRCSDCRAANREYVAKLNRRKAYGGRWWGWVDAEPARQHVRSLRPNGSRGANINGIGLKRIARLSGVPHGTLSKLVYGERGRPPAKRIRMETEAKLLAVTPEMIADGSRIDSTKTWRLIDEIVSWYNAEVGAPPSRKPDSPNRVKGRGGHSFIARELGMLPSNFVRRPYISVARARAVKALHDRLFDEHASFRWRYCKCSDTEHPRVRRSVGEAAS